MTYQDFLTGLPKRKLFSDRLDIALAHAQRNQNKVAVAMIDLDNFKEINDTLGHIVGDPFLKATIIHSSESARTSCQRNIN
jgi:diguanylate cyclase (GGDEF)-like protein